MESGFVLTFASFSPSREIVAFEADFFHYEAPYSYPHLLTKLIISPSPYCRPCKNSPGIVRAPENQVKRLLLRTHLGEHEF